MKRSKLIALMLGALIAASAAPAAEDGKALYDAKCASCHGKDGVAKPMAKGSRSFNDAAFRSESADAIAQVTSEGKGKMPGYKDKLTAEQIGAIAAHVKTLAPSK